MCLKKEKWSQHNIGRGISSSKHFWHYMPNSSEILMESTNHMLTKVVHGILKRRFIRACPCALKKNKYQVNITLEQDFIKQPFLKLYAKLKRNTNGINKPHADKSGAREFENRFICACPCALRKKNKSTSHWKRISSSNHFWNYMPNSRKILMESKKRMLTKVVPRDFEKEIFCCV